MFYQPGASSLLQNPPILLIFSSVVFEIRLRNGSVYFSVQIALARLSSPLRSFLWMFPIRAGMLVAFAPSVTTAIFVRPSMRLPLPHSRSGKPNPPSSSHQNRPRGVLQAVLPFSSDTSWPVALADTAAVILPTTPLVARLNSPE